MSAEALPIDDDDELGPADERVLELHGASERDKRLVALVCSGMKLDLAAREAGMSVSTACKHLQRLEAALGRRLPRPNQGGVPGSKNPRPRRWSTPEELRMILDCLAAGETRAQLARRLGCADITVADRIRRAEALFGVAAARGRVVLQPATVRCLWCAEPRHEGPCPELKPCGRCGLRGASHECLETGSPWSGTTNLGEACR